MYLVVENLEKVGPLGEQIPRSEPKPITSEEEEKPPEVIQEDMRLINSLWVSRVPIDDNAKALYSREEGKEWNFCLGHDLNPHTLFAKKTLYVFYLRISKVVGILVFLDKYG